MGANRNTTELPDAGDLDGNEIIAMVKDGLDKKSPLSALVAPIAGAVIGMLLADNSIVTGVFTGSSGSINFGSVTGTPPDNLDVNKFSRITYIVNAGSLVDDTVISADMPVLGADSNYRAKEINIVFHFGATPFSISAGSHCNFLSFTGVANKKSILCLIWDGTEYVQKSFSQLT